MAQDRKPGGAVEKLLAQRNSGVVAMAEDEKSGESTRRGREEGRQKKHDLWDQHRDADKTMNKDQKAGENIDRYQRDQNKDGWKR